MTRTGSTDHGSPRSWSRAAAGDRWMEVQLHRDAGARITEALLDVFPGAVLHAVVTDVLGPQEARIETVEGRRLTVLIDNAFRVTGWRMARGGRQDHVHALAA